MKKWAFLFMLLGIAAAIAVASREKAAAAGGSGAGEKKSSFWDKAAYVAKTVLWNTVGEQWMADSKPVALEFADEAWKAASLSATIYWSNFSTLIASHQDHQSSFGSSSEELEEAWQLIRQGRCRVVYEPSAEQLKEGLWAHFVVLECPQWQQVIVLFRGSQNVLDWITNLSFKPSKEAITSDHHHHHEHDEHEQEQQSNGHCQLRFHSGAYNQLSKALPLIHEAVRPFEQQNYEVLVTGHSLGGGYATLYHYLNGRHLHAHFRHVRLITFGAPLFLFSEQKDHAPCLAALGVDHHFEDSSHHFIHGRDIVPRLLGSQISATVIGSLLPHRNLHHDEEHHVADGDVAVDDEDEGRGTSVKDRLQHYFPSGNFYHCPDQPALSSHGKAEEQHKADHKEAEETEEKDKVKEPHLTDQQQKEKEKEKKRKEKEQRQREKEEQQYTCLAFPADEDPHRGKRKKLIEPDPLGFAHPGGFGAFFADHQSVLYLQSLRVYFQNNPNQPKPADPSSSSASSF